LTHVGAREYDPALGWFISVDPILDLTDPQSLNGYAYAGNNPATLADPTGLRACQPGECGTTSDGRNTPSTGDTSPLPNAGGGTHNAGGGGDDRRNCRHTGAGRDRDASAGPDLTASPDPGGPGARDTPPKPGAGPVGVRHRVDRLPRTHRARQPRSHRAVRRDGRRCGFGGMHCRLGRLFRRRNARRSDGHRRLVRRQRRRRCRVDGVSCQGRGESRR
jgi:hypothetical protein